MSGLDPKRPSRIPAYPLLDGHKRKKKKLLPPLSAFPGVKFVSTLDVILPEILWIGGAIESYGLRDAVTIVSTFLKSLWADKTKDTPEFFRHSVLAKPEFESAVLSAAGFKDVEPVFARLAAFYGRSWSPDTSTEVDGQDAAKCVRTWIKAYWNRFEQPFLLAGGTVIYSLAISDRMKFAAGIAPDLEALAQDFDSLEGKKCASFIRASLMGFFPQSSDDRAASWSRHFWDRNYEATDCVINV